MIAMNIQERYDDIVEISGLSEQVVRRVLKATQQSLMNSLKQGKNATLPGICTLYPEIRSKVNRKREVIEQEGVLKRDYIKIKAKPSSALESSFNKIGEFEQKSLDNSDETNFDGVLKLVNPELHGDKNRYDSRSAKDVIDRYKTKEASVRVSQLGSLL